MVSVQATTLSPSSRRNKTPEPENSSRKRKWDQEGDKTDHHPQGISLKLPNAMKWALDTELHLDTHLPSNFFGIKTSGQTTNMRSTFKVDQTRLSPEPLSPLHMSLDLELNLPCGSTARGRKYHAGDQNNILTNINRHGGSSSTGTAAAAVDHHLSLSFGDDHRSKNINPVVPDENINGDDHDHGWDQREMVTAVCKKCHMLVMMFKASPACPNCKFMHPLNQSPPNLFNRGGGEGLARSCVSLWN